MNLKRVLRAISTVVLEEVERNADFARRLEHALGIAEAGAAVMESGVKKSRTRSPAAIDPIAILAERGEDALRAELSILPLDKLHDVVAEFGMDTSKLVLKWKNSERVCEHIVENAKRRSVKGDAFRA